MAGQVVESIARQPLPYGLFSVLTPRAPEDDHWQNGEGVTWETLTCAPASGIGGVDCVPGEEGETVAAVGLPKNLTAGAGEAGDAAPFSIYGVYTCTPTGHDVDYATQRATEHLLAREEARVEQAIWTGDLDNGGFAADAIDAGGTFSVARSVARLEDWLAKNYGSLGVLHMTREAAIIGLDDGVLEVKSGKLVTALGTPVVAGAGYPGTGPAGEAPGANQTYVYATPALMGYRSEVFPGVDPVEAGFNTSNNDLTAVAERAYIVGYDPCGTAYVLTDLPE